MVDRKEKKKNNNKNEKQNKGAIKWLI